ncbi:hypothetical protein [Muricoccus pecuniae]|uniref:Mono/diheme cytochrome c family protein n=1 Tax=Muricoccus pecuniae TaxID=693023 RepID=A0A840YGR9_9PROT|nr:hypothetical protein [Roseomonas pecuniae]MBB5693064.1 mono/diheme cytochrome c family protein [Roseomonas pecuniae]
MRGLTALLLLMLPLAGPVQAGLVEEGEALFNRGARPGAAAPKVRTAGGQVLPATAMPCAGCHGRDGLGGTAEAGLRPPAVLWSALSRPGAGRPPYDDALLMRAVVQGTAAGGRGLDPVMPRYGLSVEDGRALSAYLRALDGMSAPGVEEGLVRIGLLLPAGPGGEAFARAFEGAIAAAAPEGVFGRRVTVLPASIPDPGALAEEVARLAGAGLLALVSALPVGPGEEVAALAAREGVPLLSVRAGAGAAGRAFALLPGPVEEGAALLRLVPDAGRALIVAGEGASERLLAERIAERFGEIDDAAPEVVPLPALAARAAEASAVLLVAGPEAVGRAASAMRGTGVPLMIPGALGGGAAPRAAAATGRQVLVGFGTPPGGGDGAARQRFAASPAAAAGLTGRLGHAAGEVMVEALRRAGRRLTREGLSAALDAPEPFETGSLPRLRPAGGGRAATGGILLGWVDERGAILPASEPAAMR